MVDTHMTTYQELRCQHCRVRYTYQPSGPDCFREDNHNLWCPECAVVALRALKEHRPQQVDFQWEEIDDPTCQMLVEIEEKRAAAAKAQGRLFARRSLAPLYDTTGTRGLHRQGILSGIPEYPRATFRYEWWERLGVEQGTAYIKIEVNLVTGTRRPWVDLPRC